MLVYNLPFIKAKATACCMHLLLLGLATTQKQQFYDNRSIIVKVRSGLEVYSVLQGHISADELMSNLLTSVDSFQYTKEMDMREEVRDAAFVSFTPDPLALVESL